MNKDRVYKASVYKSTENDFKNFCNNKKLAFKGKYREYDNFTEVIVSDVNIEKRIDNLKNDIGLSEETFEEQILSLNNDLCRVIYNNEKKCMFLVNNNTSKWLGIAVEMGLRPLNLTNDLFVKKIKKNSLKNLFEMKVVTNLESDINTYLLKGDNLEQFDQFEDILKNTTRVDMYKRRMPTYEVEVLSPNLIALQGIKDEIDLRNSLSRLVMGSYYER